MCFFVIILVELQKQQQQIYDKPIFILSCNFDWIFYKLFNTTMSLQSFCNLSWQIETYNSLQK